MRKKKMKLKSTLFFGYHKKTVDSVLSDMTQEKELLCDKVTKQQKVIDELTTQLTIQKNKETLIADVLLESKRTAHKTMAHAQEQAEIHMKEMYERLNRNVTQVQEKITVLEDLNEQLLGLEQTMKQELRQVLERQMDALENIDLSAYESIKNDVAVAIDSSQEMIDSARKIIEFPAKDEKKKDDVEDVPIFMISNG